MTSQHQKGNVTINFLVRGIISGLISARNGGEMHCWDFPKSHIKSCLSYPFHNAWILMNIVSVGSWLHASVFFLKISWIAITSQSDSMISCHSLGYYKNSIRTWPFYVLLDHNHQVAVSIHGGTPSSHPFSIGKFSRSLRNPPASYWGTPHDYGNPQVTIMKSIYASSC